MISGPASSSASGSVPLSAPSASARWLGYAGLIPFVALALAVALNLAPGSDAHARWLIGYAALIASFLGGIHWGMVMRSAATNATDANDAPGDARLGWGVAPSLLAWAAWWMPPAAALLWLAAVLVLCFIVDRGAYRTAGAAAWLGLRLQLTTVAALSCLLAAWSLG